MVQGTLELIVCKLKTNTYVQRYFDDHYMMTEVPYPAKEIREKIKKAKVQEQVNRRRSVMGSFRPRIRISNSGI